MRRHRVYVDAESVIRLLAIDIDGTLLDSRGQLPGAHRDALVDAVSRGIEVALVTGRSFHFTQPVMKLLPIPLWIVVNNGALVKNAAGDTVLRHLLDKDVARGILQQTRAHEESVAIIFDRPDERQIVFERMDWSLPNRRGYYEKNKAYIAAATAPLTEMLTEDPIQLMFNGGVAPMRALAASLRALPSVNQFSFSVTEYESRDFTLLDVNGAGCSKGATLARWTAARGLTPKEVMAVGDNLNDVEMLDFAGTAVVMGNATEAMKTRGYVATRSNDEDGLAVAIRRHALAELHENHTPSSSSRG